MDSTKSTTSTVAVRRRKSERPKIAVVIIDETGNDGLNELEPIFATGATIFDNKRKFGNISRMRRLRTGVKELKYKDAPTPTKQHMNKKLETIEYKTIGVYIDKEADNNPEWWIKEDDRHTPHVKMIEELAKDLVEENVNEVVIDRHYSYNYGEKGKHQAEKIIKEALEMANKPLDYIKEEDSETGKHRNLLQTNDFVIGNIGKKLRAGVEKGDKFKFRRLRMSEQ